ncbi:MAG: GGDEF domain-containing protein, partial [Geobacteraceae bacterium]|nr:GGDEF domain-containing protein [Geobacteraceae bacterium]
MNELAQVFDSVNIGLVILDTELRVRYWNRWMEDHSGIAADRLVGSPLFDHFPSLNTPKFQRSCKSVLTFGNFSFFSQKLHQYLFPFKPDSSFQSRFDRMQQSCSMGPLRDGDNTIIGLFLTVQDVTELAAYEHRLLEMNMRDGLTGVYNRRFLEKRLEEECARYARYGRGFSVILFDIDFFKNVNDTYGHLCGDLILKNISGTIASLIRKTDFLARYGGEEFCCLLPETVLASAALLAERFRATIAEMKHVYQGIEISVTVSLGVAEMNTGMLSFESLLKKADEAL